MKKESRVRSLLNVRLAERGMTKKELAQRLGVTPATVWRWSTDSGMAAASLDTLSMVAAVVGCPTSELFVEVV